MLDRAAKVENTRSIRNTPNIPKTPEPDLNARAAPVALALSCFVDSLT
jgi:hypothetical protein